MNKWISAKKTDSVTTVWPLKEIWVRREDSCVLTVIFLSEGTKYIDPKEEFLHKARVYSCHNKKYMRLLFSSTILF